MKNQPDSSLSEIKTELLALTGSTTGYEELLANLGEQMRLIAQRGGKICLKPAVSTTAKARARR